MKKVLHLNASSGGGAFVVAQRLHEAVQASGEMQSSHLVFTGQPGNYTLWSDSSLKKAVSFGLHALEKLDFLRFEKSKAQRFAFSHGRTGISLSEHPLFKEADLLHIHWLNKGFVSLAGLEAALRSGKPVLWTCHDMWPFTGGCYHNRGCNNYQVACGNCQYLRQPKPNDLSHRVFLKKQQLNLNYSNLHYVTPSHWLADIGAASGVGLREKPQVIPNGIDTTRFAPDTKIQRQQSERRHQTGRLKVLFVASNLSNRYKGFREFCAIVQATVQQGIPIDFTVVGGRQPEDVSVAGFPIQFLPAVGTPEALIALYREHDAYITTSLEENLPTTVIESIACGTPVLAYNVGGMADIISEGKEGYLFPLQAVEAVVTRLAALYSADAAAWVELQNACRAKAVQVFEQQVVTAAYLDTYKRLLATE
jgi:glycosyltransferase involved in cell wall biosynthesis